MLQFDLGFMIRSRPGWFPGENLQTMVTLYKYRGEVDLIITDPPYNTGQQFRYNDKWDEDPNDPELGTLVAKEDGSRHTKWIKAIMPPADGEGDAEAERCDRGVHRSQ